MMMSQIAVAASAVEQAKINYLLHEIGVCQCKFVRNGSEYSGGEAVDHLNGKLEKAGDKIKTADDFIAHIASESSATGKPYMIKLSDGTQIPTKTWLSDKLSHYLVIQE